MVCQDINLKIFMFGSVRKELKLYKEYIVGGAGTCLKISNSIFKCLNLLSFLLRWKYYKISPGLKVRRLSKVDELQKSDNLSGISLVLCTLNMGRLNIHCTAWDIVLHILIVLWFPLQDVTAGETYRSDISRKYYQFTRKNSKICFIILSLKSGGLGLLSLYQKYFSFLFCTNY